MGRLADMRPLTEMQAAFVRELVANHGNATDAAIKAGYSRDSAAQRASELRKLPHVQAAIQAEMRRSFTDLAAIALGQVEMMLTDPRTPASARVDIVKLVLDRAGLGAPKTTEEDSGDKPIRELSFVQLQALAVRATLRLADDTSPTAAEPLLEGELVAPAVDASHARTASAGE